MSQFRFVQVNEFQANVPGWNQIGPVSWTQPDPLTILLTNQAGYQVKISFLSATALRVRFRPVPNPDYSNDNSYAVVNRNLGAVQLSVQELPDDGGTLKVDTGVLQVFIGLNPYGISVQQNGKVITEDTFGSNLIFSNQAVANLKKSPLTESYFGFGEKAGNQIDKKGFTMTFFNYDNFTYNDITFNGGKVVPADNEGGPLNPSSPLYNSMPFTLAIGKGNPSVEYAYGIFLDNVSQSYFNMGANDYSDMDGKYYFGALYGELDYYVFVGTENDRTQNKVVDVIDQYSSLTGASAMPPMYALGYHQGGYGYFDQDLLKGVAAAYRQQKIPMDGLHIDVDFQNNYRTFTSSGEKFGDAKTLFDELHAMGYKCSTNITGIITANPMDEQGKEAGTAGYEPYPTRDDILNLNPTSAGLSTYKANAPTHPFLTNTRITETGTVSSSSDLFIANESYGSNTGLPSNRNPYSYPDPTHPQGQVELGTYGFYCDMANPDVAAWWGEQYEYLLKAGLDMIWQDMTCPAVVPNAIDNTNEDKTLPLDLAMFDKVSGQMQPNGKIHNYFAIALIEATYHGLTKLKTSTDFQGLYNYRKRNFIIARGGYSGVHRYAGIWTGDSASSWDFLSINIPEVLNIGISGQPISGCDIGGFANGSGSAGQGITDYELFTRWMNLGAFLPWYRNHYDRYTKLFQEPYNYGAPVPDHCRTYIEIRYRLLQLFYDCAFENTQTGMPIARALFLQELNDPQVFTYADQEFFVGKDLLVAPVVSANTYNREVYLPAGNNWYVFDLEGPLAQATTGGQSYNWYVPLGLVPVYVREGAILPIRELEQFVGELPKNPLSFWIYPGGQGSSYQLYQDDKETMDAEEHQAYRLTEIQTSYSGTELQIDFQRTHDQFTPAEDFYYLNLLGRTTAPAEVEVGTDSLSPVADQAALEQSSQNAYYYDAPNQRIWIKIFDTQPATSIVVK